MTWFLIGIAAGVLLTIPIVIFASRRTAARVRLLEQRALASQRLAEIGTTTGGLAHEIKNPLSSINLNVQLLHEDLQQLAGHFPDGSPQREQLGRTLRRFDALGRESARIKQILEDFLRFAGRMQLDRQPVDVHQLIEELADFFEPQAHEAGVRIRTQLVAEQHRTLADEGLLKQALLNLMINATKAMSQARRQQIEPGQAPGHGGADELILRTDNARELGQFCLRIHVIDIGPGVRKDQQLRIFQPYVSGSRGGTGLGLPTARRIAEEHGGSLTLHSDDGKGSDFTLSLPLNPDT